MAYRDRSIGYVYVLLNPAFPSQVKIGRTGRTSKLRAKDLFTTGVPTEFIVLWHEFVHDSITVEHKLHEIFGDDRVYPKREFFKVEPRDAISALIDIATPFRIALDGGTRVSIFTQLKDRFGTSLRNDIYDVTIGQGDYGIFLEVRRRPYKDQKREVTDYVDLDVVGDYMSERHNLATNVEKFLTMDDVGLIMVTNLFEEEAARAIWEKHLADDAKGG